MPQTLGPTYPPSARALYPVGVRPMGAPSQYPPGPSGPNVRFSMPGVTLVSTTQMTMMANQRPLLVGQPAGMMGPPLLRPPGAGGMVTLTHPMP